MPPTELTSHCVVRIHNVTHLSIHVCNVYSKSICLIASTDQKHSMLTLHWVVNLWRLVINFCLPTRFFGRFFILCSHYNRLFIIRQHFFPIIFKLFCLPFTCGPLPHSLHSAFLLSGLATTIRNSVYHHVPPRQGFQWLLLRLRVIPGF